MASKVIFMGDTQRGEQNVNILRLQTIFAPVFKNFGIPTEAYITAANKLDGQRRNEWLETWKESLDNRLGSTLKVEDVQNAAVIGFEAASRDFEFLDSRGIPWMNFTIHPLRFLDDLYFEVQTSFQYDLSRHAAPAGLIDMCVEVLRNRYGATEVRNDADALVIFGQTPIDRSVYFDGDYRSLGDYLGPLDRIAARYKRILYRPHPYLSNPDVDAMIKSRYGAELSSQRDVYQLLVSGEIAAVCAISSSILTEAPYFGIKSEFLEPRARRYGLPIGYRALLDDASLWEGFLGRAGDVKTSLRISDAVPDGYLRSIFSSWGFMSESDREHERYERLLAQSEASHRVSSEQLHASVAQLTAQVQNTMALIERMDASIAQLNSEWHANHQTIQAMRASMSWRITAPFRWVTGTLRGETKSSFGAHASVFLQRAGRYINRRPKLNRAVRSLLNRFPGLKARILGVAAGVTSARQQTEAVPTQLAHLTPRARQIYTALQTARENKKRTN